MLDMKEKSVKSMMKSGGRDAAPATGKQKNQDSKGRKGKPSGPDAAPVLPKAKAKGHAGKNGKSDGASDRGKSPSGSKDNPCWYHFKAAKGCIKGNECTDCIDRHLNPLQSLVGSLVLLLYWECQR